MATDRPIITLTTDFGLTDAYVGQMKGAVLSVCPQAVLVDLSHHIPPQDVTAAGRMVVSSYRFFPAGSVHVAVVDPGVGTARRPLAVRADGHVFVAPDNGLLTGLLDRAEEIREITDPEMMRPEVSATFHGRDIFGPTAGHLARGLDVAAVGPLVGNPVHLEEDRPLADESGLTGRVTAIDHFGNLVTDIPAGEVPERMRGEVEVETGGTTMTGIHRTYGQVAPGAVLALVGSHGFVEIGVNRGRADRLLEAGPGQRVRLTWPQG